MSMGEFGLPTFSEGDRVSASALSKLAQLAGRGNAEVDAYIDIYGNYTANYPPIETWAFELAELLPQWETTTPTLAYRRFIDPTANGGYGAYVTDCSDSSRFWVMDLREVGYWGPAGHTGAARIILVEQGRMGIIVDLRCPAGCICGQNTVALPCPGGT